MTLYISFIAQSKEFIDYFIGYPIVPGNSTIPDGKSISNEATHETIWKYVTKILMYIVVSNDY